MNPEEYKTMSDIIKELSEDHQKQRRQIADLRGHLEDIYHLIELRISELDQKYGTS